MLWENFNLPSLRRFNYYIIVLYIKPLWKFTKAPHRVQFYNGTGTIACNLKIWYCWNVISLNCCFYWIFFFLILKSKVQCQDCKPEERVLKNYCVWAKGCQLARSTHSLLIISPLVLAQHSSISKTFFHKRGMTMESRAARESNTF